MSGVLRSEPKAVVLVGQAAFCELTRSTIGPELLLRVYQTALRTWPSRPDTISMCWPPVSSRRSRDDPTPQAMASLIYCSPDFIGSNLGQQDRPHLPAASAPQTPLRPMAAQTKPPENQRTHTESMVSKRWALTPGFQFSVTVGEHQRAGSFHSRAYQMCC